MQDIKNKVKSLIKKYGTRDPEQLAKELKINIIYRPYSDCTKGYSINIKRNRFIIINSNLDEKSTRVVLAHELGHALLHSKHDIYFIREKTLFPTGKYEHEANKFAAELLIEDSVLYEYTGLTIEQIAVAEETYEELIRLKAEGIHRST